MIPLLSAADLLQLFQPGVHGGVDVRRFRLEIALVVNQPGRIEGPYGLCTLYEITAECRFIAKRPHNDGGMIKIPLYHADGTVHVRGFPRRIVGDPCIVFHPLEPVAF